MSQYGNVTLEDVEAMGSAVDCAYQISALTPGGAPASWRSFVYETVLDGILNDWVENGTKTLAETDKEDIENLVRVCIAIAGKQDVGIQDVTFRVLVKNAMHDWVANWNADEED